MTFSGSQKKSPAETERSAGPVSEVTMNNAERKKTVKKSQRIYIMPILTALATYIDSLCLVP